MTDQQGRSLLIGAFIIAIIMVCWDEITVKKVPPRPARFVGAGVAFGLLGLAAPVISYRLAGLFAVGFALTLMYKHYATGPESTAPGQGAAEGAA